MKRILMLFLSLPLLTMAQEKPETPAEPKTPKTEIGLSMGYAPDNAFNPFGGLRGGYFRDAITAVRNFGNMQIGLTVEGGTNSNDFWYLMPGLVFNHTFHTGKSYFYFGAMGGYAYEQDMLGGGYFNSFEKPYADGYVLGLQGGYVLGLSKHWAFTSEIAFRSVQISVKGTEVIPLWNSPTPDYIEVPYKERDYTIYLPITIGMRYRF